MKVRLETAEGKPVNLEQEIPEPLPQIIVLERRLGSCFMRYFMRVFDVKPPTYREATVAYVTVEE